MVAIQDGLEETRVEIHCYPWQRGAVVLEPTCRADGPGSTLGLAVLFSLLYIFLRFLFLFYAINVFVIMLL